MIIKPDGITPATEATTSSPYSEQKCPICGEQTHPAGQRQGRVEPLRVFFLVQCPTCFYSFVNNSRTDFEVIYNDDYYSGKGADPLVNYNFESQHLDTTIRRFEWEGLCKIFSSLTSLKSKAKWLDYGCGNGGVVKFGRQKQLNIYGYEPNADLQDNNILDSSSLEEFVDEQGGFDFVSVIEVIEHVSDPLTFLKSVRKFLATGGVLFLTTGNAKPWRNKLESWAYTSCPDVYISFFEPQTLALALEKSGFEAQNIGYIDGFTEIIKFKIIKNWGVKKDNFIFNLLPWPILSRLANWRAGVSAHPLGIAK